MKSIKKMFNKSVKKVEGVSKQAKFFVDGLDENELAKIAVMSSEELIKILPEGDKVLAEEILNLVTDTNK